MDWKENALVLIKEHAIALGMGMIGLVCLLYGLFSLGQTHAPSDPEFQTEPQTAEVIKNPITPTIKKITIDIEGSVQKPGVYSLPATSRMQDALIAAGGLSQSADRQRVAQMLNLAAPLTDSAKIYIPAVGEQYSGTEGTSGNGSTTAVAGATTININQATESDLDALPGVGPVTAQKIIDNRPYQNIQELLDKKVVGQSVFSKIKDQISIY